MTVPNTATTSRLKTPMALVNERQRAADERRRAADAELVKKNADPTGEEAARYQRLELVKEAIAAEGVALPHHIEGLIVERVQQWNSSLRPANVFECWMTELVAKESLKIEESDKMFKHQTCIRSRRAEIVELWRNERGAEIAESANEFASQWTVLVPKLKTTAAGVEWLLSRWLELADTFDARGNLTAAQRLLAVKLQGRPLEILMTDPVQNGSTVGEELRGARRRDRRVAECVGGGSLSYRRDQSSRRRHRSKARRFRRGEVDPPAPRPKRESAEMGDGAIQTRAVQPRPLGQKAEFSGRAAVPRCRTGFAAAGAGAAGRTDAGSSGERGGGGSACQGREFLDGDGAEGVGNDESVVFGVEQVVGFLRLEAVDPRGAGPRTSRPRPSQGVASEGSAGTGVSR